RNHSGSVDDGDPRAPVEAERGWSDPTIVALAEKIDLGLRELHLVVELILVGHIVNQPGTDGVLVQKRTVINERANFLLGLVTAVRNAANELVVQVGIERLGHLAMGWRVGVF